MKPGIYKNLSNTDYHASEGISKSGLDLIAKSPAHYLSQKEHGRLVSDSTQKNFDIGSAFHCLVLEPGKFDAEFVVSEKFNRRTKEGKEAFAKFQEISKNKTIIEQDDFNLIKLMTESVKRHPAASILLSDGIAESSYYWIDNDTGELCKCRPDWLRNDGIAVDLKSSQDASPEGFAKACANYHYDKQAAFYQDGIKANNIHVSQFVFIAVEKTPPYAVGVYVLDSESVEYGRESYQANLSRYAIAKHNQNWPAYSEKVEEISLPLWAFK